MAFRKVFYAGMDKYVVLLIPTTLSFPGIIEVQAKCLVQLR